MNIMNNVIGRILTGICGGLVMAAVNHWNSLQGWAYGGSIAAAFVVFFGTAVLFERLTGKKPAALNNGVGSHNKAKGNQQIDIAPSATSTTSGSLGSGNEAGGDQTIKIG